MIWLSMCVLVVVFLVMVFGIGGFLVEDGELYRIILDRVNG